MSLKAEKLVNYEQIVMDMLEGIEAKFVAWLYLEDFVLTQ